MGRTPIRFLHDLGVVLNFNDEGNPHKLKDTTILKSEWVTAGVYAMINDNRLCRTEASSPTSTSTASSRTTPTRPTRRT